MLLLCFILLILSALLLIVGLLVPDWTVLWRPYENRERKSAFTVFGLLFLVIFCLNIGLLTNWLIMVYSLLSILGIIALFVLLVGLIFPMKVMIIEDPSDTRRARIVNRRYRILAQYGILFILLFTCIVVLETKMPGGVVDERIPGGTYEGAVHNGVMHGEGKLFNHITTYTGQWVNNKRNGYGKEFTDLGIFTVEYEGNWQDNRENGQGKRTITFLGKTHVYEGEWKEGKREGYGKLTGRSGVTYEGNWLNNEPEGQGTITLKDGETYVGEVRDWKRNGYGKAISPDGVVLEGEWQDDELGE